MTPGGNGGDTDDLLRAILLELGRHGVQFERHGKILEQHGKVLERHEKILERHEKLLEKQASEIVGLRIDVGELQRVLMPLVTRIDATVSEIAAQT